ncbi:MAG: tryptophan-rich sensory protein [Lachnospiraceae bacterium]|nr:tryptophan-rich sensory protein [Candidatus Colinaster scatohippi]
MKKISILTLLIALFIPLVIGGISAALSSQGMATYGSMSKPPLSPPAWVFSVAWTILYIMMGLASYFIIVSEADNRDKAMALIIYGIQLAMNFMWSIMFFNWGYYLFAFMWLMIMWCIVILCAVRFYSINRVATYLFIPYIMWLTFAAYLNMGAYILSIE